jgi:predicted NBD/HSP70 family sugar kinase
MSPEGQRVSQALARWPEVVTDKAGLKRPFFATIHVAGRRTTASGILDYHGPRDFRITAVTELGVVLFDARMNWAGISVLRQMPGLDKSLVQTLVGDLSLAFHLPSSLQGLAMKAVAALAEALWGAGSSYRNVFYVTLGTGIGTGMVLDKRLYHGRTGVAGEGGHMTIDFNGPQCGCGKRGCIEMYASGTAVGRIARNRLAQEPSAVSRMRDLVNGHLERVTADVVGNAALAGDPLANAIMFEAAERLAIWLGNLIDLLEPEIIVIGGGFGQLMREYINSIRERLEVWGINPRRREIPIRSALYGPEAGLMGSGALCLQTAQSWMAAFS